jgi:L-alanine-DL-glutamate epimerase-like enolase superfamily enzyme
MSSTSPGSRSPSPRTTTAATRLARGFGRTPLAAGENHYTRFEFNRVIEDGSITILQPDLSKTGGLTEALRIAAMASACKAAHPPAQLDDRPQPRGLDPFPRRHR